jgi:hypothetical protein
MKSNVSNKIDTYNLAIIAQMISRAFSGFSPEKPDVFAEIVCIGKREVLTMGLNRTDTWLEQHIAGFDLERNTTKERFDFLIKILISPFIESEQLNSDEIKTLKDEFSELQPFIESLCSQLKYMQFLRIVHEYKRSVDELNIKRSERLLGLKLVAVVEYRGYELTMLEYNSYKPSFSDLHAVKQISSLHIAVLSYALVAALEPDVMVNLFNDHAQRKISNYHVRDIIAFDELHEYLNQFGFYQRTRKFENYCLVSKMLYLPFFDTVANSAEINQAIDTYNNEIKAHYENMHQVYSGIDAIMMLRLTYTYRMHINKLKDSNRLIGSELSSILMKNINLVTSANDTSLYGYI